MTRPTRRRLLPAAVVALFGAAALAVGLHQRPDHQPAVTTVATPAAVAADESMAARPDEATLTRGLLLPTSAPARMAIPALRVDVPLAELGLAADGSMQVPADATTVGWFTHAPAPGSLGPAVLAGHVDYRGRPGTFARLSELRAGDRVTIARRDGLAAVFAVTKVERYAKDRFPTAAVYGPIDHAGLRLITCGGDFDTRSGHYEDNIVVFAELRTAVRR